MKRRCSLGTVLVVSLTIASTAQAQSLCASTSKLAVDADGAPDSYRVDGKGLSYTCDGVFGIVNGVAHTQKNDPKHWQEVCNSKWAAAKASNDYSQVKIVGFLKDGKGRPMLQGAGDPFPGEAYVTTTSLSIAGMPSASQRRYVNAREIPFVVLPTAWAQARNVSLGGVIAVHRPSTNRTAFAVFADCCSMGEGSVRLHRDLGSDPIIVRNGVERAKREITDRIVFIALPNVQTTPTVDAAKWRAEIQSKGAAALAAAGGDALIGTCVKP